MFRQTFEENRTNDAFMCTIVKLKKIYNRINIERICERKKDILPATLIDPNVRTLKKIIDNPLGELAFNKSFDEKRVTELLNDEYFIYFLEEIELIDQVININNYDSLIRIYSAMLTYDEVMESVTPIPGYLHSLVRDNAIY